jgi:hypothetical protein
MNRIVICRNDFPYELLPEGATTEQALAYCGRLQDDAAAGEEPFTMRQHFHCHEIIETHWVNLFGMFGDTA